MSRGQAGSAVAPVHVEGFERIPSTKACLAAWFSLHGDPCGAEAVAIRADSRWIGENGKIAPI